MVTCIRQWHTLFDGQIHVCVGGGVYLPADSILLRNFVDLHPLAVLVEELTPNVDALDRCLPISRISYTDAVSGRDEVGELVQRSSGEVAHVPWL